MWTNNIIKRNNYTIKIRAQQTLVPTLFSSILSLTVKVELCKVYRIYASTQTPLILNYQMTSKPKDQTFTLEGLRFFTNCDIYNLTINVTSERGGEPPEFIKIVNISETSKI